MAKARRRKVIGVPTSLSDEFEELVVRPTGLRESEVLRSLMLHAIREEKRYRVLKANQK